MSTAITMLESYTSSGSWRMLFVLELVRQSDQLCCDILIFRGRSLVDRSPHGRVSFLRLFHHQGSKHARVWRYLIFFSGTGTLFQYQIFPMLVPVLFLVLYFSGTGSGTFFSTKFFRYRFRYNPKSKDGTSPKWDFFKPWKRKKMRAEVVILVFCISTMYTIH